MLKSQMNRQIKIKKMKKILILVTLFLTFLTGYSQKGNPNKKDGAQSKGVIYTT